MKQVDDANIGDTVTLSKNPAEEVLAGYKSQTNGIFRHYPVDTNDYEDLKVALEKLKLNDSSFTYETESSKALGFGFRCGYSCFIWRYSRTHRA